MDVLVIMETSSPQAERYATVSNVLWPRQFPVDIIDRVPEELRQAFDAGDLSLCEVVQPGQVVYEQQR